MSREREPLSTEVSSLGTEVVPRPSTDWHSESPDDQRAGAPAEGSGQRDVAAAGQRLAIGQILGGRYRIERELGEGGMGVVYLAKDAQIAGETFAIKVLKEPLDAQALSLLREEVRRTRKLSHPNVVDVHSVNVDGQRLYVLMEYLEGKSLDGLLDEEFGRGMPFSHAWPIIEDVGAALSNAHDHNVVHSDLKPANVFVTTAGRTKLLDFGIARVSRGPLLHKPSGPLALTPDYASCEMLEGKEADRRDDIYSFACVIYEMLCGERPFGELTALEAREAAAKVTPLQGLSRQQNAALAQALAFDREGRTASVEKLLEGLAAEQPRSRPAALLVAVTIAVVAAVSLTYLALDRLWVPRHSVVVKGATSEFPPTPPFNPPPHSIAVLPFTNLSGDPKQEYFSDGMSEELINALSHIESMSVAARTSAFSFKGQNADIGTIGRKLNVSAVLEGSVRRSGHRVRITAQLINTISGFHLWSEDYDRDLNDNLELQTEIATAVAQELEARLLGSEAARIELGGTHNSEAYDAYLRGTQLAAILGDEVTHRASVKEFDRAISIDPNYALAYAARAFQLIDIVVTSNNPETREQLTREASDSARRALTLAPDLSQAHGALSFVLALGFFDFSSALAESKRAVELAPGSDLAQVIFAMTSGWAGHHDDAIRGFLAAVSLDPQNFRNRINLASEYNRARRFSEALTAVRDAEAIKPDGARIGEVTAQSYLAMGQALQAKRACEDPTLKVTVPLRYPHWCLALAYHQLGDLANAERELSEYLANSGKGSAYERGELYAQLGRPTEALMWLSTAYRLRDPDLQNLKMDWMLDPVRNEPEFKAIERGLNFPP
jgi:TolB-like protein